jgi:hypothetical protein
MNSFGRSRMQRFLKENGTLSNPKSDGTIVWNPGGFHLVNILPKGFKFNASYYVTQILDPLSKWRRLQVARTNRKLIMHADNARAHTAKGDIAIYGAEVEAEGTTSSISSVSGSADRRRGSDTESQTARCPNRPHRIRKSAEQVWKQTSFASIVYKVASDLRKS